MADGLDFLALVLDSLFSAAVRREIRVILRGHRKMLKLLNRMFTLTSTNQYMNVQAVARALNRRAAQQKWYHFCDPPLAFSKPLYEQFLSLWQRKAGTRTMPAKSEITPRDLKDFLPDIVVFHRVAENPSH
jgi:hypothetical protein